MFSLWIFNKDGSGQGQARTNIVKCTKGLVHSKAYFPEKKKDFAQDFVPCRRRSFLWLKSFLAFLSNIMKEKLWNTSEVLVIAQDDRPTEILRPNHKIRECFLSCILYQHQNYYKNRGLQLRVVRHRLMEREFFEDLKPTNTASINHSPQSTHIRALLTQVLVLGISSSFQQKN
jgi:hypothetical protein